MKKEKKGGSLILAAAEENICEKQTGYPILVSAALITGMALLFVPSFESIGISPWTFAATGIVLCTAFIFLYQGRFQRYVLMASVVLCMLAAILLFAKVKSGALILTNDFLDFLTEKTGRIYLAYETGPKGDVIYILDLLWLLLCAFTAKAAQTSRIAFILLPLGLCFASITLGFIKLSAGFAFLVFGLVLLVLRGVQLRSNPGCSEKSLPAHALAVLVCASIVLCGFLLPELETKGIISSVKGTVHELVYDEKSNSMPEGDLSDLPAWEPTGTKALAIYADKYSKLYLRGFTGEIYTGNTWESIEKESLAKYKDRFYWLHKDGFYAQTMIAEALELFGDEEPANMSIQNISACRKYAYMPYSAFGDDFLDPGLIGDLYAQGKEYEKMSYYPGSIPEWYDLQHKLAAGQDEFDTASYLKDEQQYREFVFDNYLQLTPAAVKTLKEYLDSDNESRSLSEIRQIILRVLDENLEYDEKAYVMNGKVDFLSCLFEQEGRGYSVAYATSAVLMLRYYGVPARYVEGYFLPREEAEAVPAGGRCVLDERHAHAWAEYYLDGAGWIPFEVTPGYIDENEYELGTSGSEGGVVYDHNELVYTPTSETKPIEEESGPRNSFKVGLPFILVLAALLLLAFAALCAVRRIRLKRTLERVRAMDNRSCIAMLYAYADMLLKKAKIKEAPEGAAKELNSEAMFSDHDMSEGQKEEMERYVGEVKGMCLKEWNFIFRLYYRFVNCIFI